MTPTDSRFKWSERKRAAFARLAPHALCIVASEGPVAVRVQAAAARRIRGG